MDIVKYNSNYTYEKYKFYKKRVDNLVKNSFITTVSSFGFFRFLENNKKIYLTIKKHLF